MRGHNGSSGTDDIRGTGDAALPRGQVSSRTRFGAAVCDEPVFFRRAIGIAAACMMVLAVCISFVDCRYLGITPEGWTVDGSVPVWYSEDAEPEYDELADALLNGSFTLRETPPEWLSQMDDPYDPDARDAMQEQTGERYRWDAAYFDGQYYVYFGVVPCLIFFVPYHLITGGMPLPTGIPVLIGVLFYIAAFASILVFSARERYPRARIGTMVWALIGGLSVSGLLYALVSASLYQIPVTTALAFAAWGFYFWLRAHCEDRTGFYLAGAVCVALIIGCRPLLACIAVFGLFPLATLLKRPTTRGKAQALCALIVPFVIVCAAIGWYNFARFGSPLDFGSSYNLTAVNVRNHGFDLIRIPVGLYNYLLQPPFITDAYPFLHPVDLGAAWSGGNYVEAMVGGLFATFPFLWFIFVMIPLRHHSRSTATVLFGSVFAVALAMLDAEVGGMCGRYQMDFAFLLAIAAVCAVAAASDAAWGEDRMRLRAFLRFSVPATVLLALAFNGLLLLFLTTEASAPTGVDLALVNPMLDVALRGLFGATL